MLIRFTIKRPAGPKGPAVQLRTPSDARVASQHCSILRMGRANVDHLSLGFKSLHQQNLIFEL